MPVSMTLQVLESHVYGNQPAKFIVTLANSGGDDVEVDRIVFDCSPAYPANLGVLRASPVGETTVAAAGSLVLAGEAVFFASLPANGEAGDQTGFDVRIVAEFSDGTVATSNDVTVQVEPVLEGTVFYPQAGIARLAFDSNNNSSLFPVVL